jgi:hypothetical protein
VAVGVDEVVEDDRLVLEMAQRLPCEILGVIVSQPLGQEVGAILTVLVPEDLLSW